MEASPAAGCRRSPGAAIPTPATAPGIPREHYSPTPVPGPDPGPPGAAADRCGYKAVLLLAAAGLSAYPEAPQSSGSDPIVLATMVISMPMRSAALTTDGCRRRRPRPLPPPPRPAPGSRRVRNPLRVASRCPGSTTQPPGPPRSHSRPSWRVMDSGCPDQRP